MIKGLLQFFLMKKFPRLTLIGLGAAALISLIRERRGHGHAD
jgi:hypothetical protein